MKKKEEENSTEDNQEEIPEEDLPEPFTPTKKKQHEFSEGDLIFAKSPKYLYWPAVFYRYMGHRRKKKNGRKAYIHYLEKLTESDKKIVIPLSINYIKKFTCEDRESLINEGKLKYGIDFTSGIERAEEFLRKKALGKMQSEDFFYSVEEKESDDEEEKSTVEEQSYAEEKTKNEKDESDLCKNNVNRSFFKPAKSRSLRRRNKDITLWIAQQSRPILRQISEGAVVSERHEVFWNGTRKEKDKLKWSAGNGPLNEEEIDEVSKLLSSWFHEDCEDTNTCPVAYIFDVWLPEAIIRALQHVRKKSYEEAEKEYLGN